MRRRGRSKSRRVWRGQRQASGVLLGPSAEVSGPTTRRGELVRTPRGWGRGKGERSKFAQETQQMPRRCTALGRTEDDGKPRHLRVCPGRRPQRSSSERACPGIRAATRGRRACPRLSSRSAPLQHRNTSKPARRKTSHRCGARSRPRGGRGACRHGGVGDASLNLSQTLLS